MRTWPLDEFICGFIIWNHGLRTEKIYVAIWLFLNGFITTQSHCDMEWLTSLRPRTRMVVILRTEFSISFIEIFIVSLKTKGPQFDNFVVTGGTVSCRNDNLRRLQRRQKLSNWRYFVFSVPLKSPSENKSTLGQAWCRIKDKAVSVVSPLDDDAKTWNSFP